jgi:rhodanese-related sulfurtransferase
MINFLKKMFSKQPAVDYKSLLKNGGVIIDVRSQQEFEGGHIKGSVNIPLDKINNSVTALKKYKGAIITVCFSGARSGMAKKQLLQHGFEVYNGGNWQSLQSKI